jgi:alpha-1,2-mannosyltransferase
MTDAERPPAPPEPSSAGRSTRPAEIMTVGAIGLVVVAYIAFGLKTAANSLGCDFSAYYKAATQWFAGQPIYDLSVSSTGICGTYQYPPPFVLLAAPFSLFGFNAGNWLWIGFLLGCWAIGTAILPVRPTTRVLILLLGAIGWPLIYGVRIGQVAPILYLLFAIAWRSLERPVWLGATVAVGAMLKLQPGLLALWLLARRDWRALAVAAVVGAAIAAVAVLVGLSDWFGFLTLLRSLTNAVDIPVNMAIGATLRSLGMSLELARTIQTLNTVVIALVVIGAGIRLPRTAGFLVAVIATQLISPIVWAHYALLLLLPVAWLLDRRQWWAVLIPLVHVWVLLPVVPNWTYAVAFHAALIGVIVVGWREGRPPASPARAGLPPTPGTLPEPAV